ncbi:hypothetical protein [Segetibacter aerophilus]|uniref:Uncharacterized protein n=1 Tax=Segetibacter aerophilus TaxID=670293 RepID=A0A512BGN1_9BACT|nr:hypothetical protein [Segetibacter aerophilus]GEO11123.1 hypothetical protein SAE01_36190 [Segetibacter aerophilus]
MHYKRMYLFDDNSELDRLIEENCEGNLRIKKVKFKFIISKGLTVKAHHKKQYEQSGFGLRIQAGPGALANDPNANIGTLQYLFGGSTKQITEIINQLKSWGIIYVFKEAVRGESSRKYKFTPHYEGQDMTMRWFSRKDAKFIEKWHNLWQERLKDPLYQRTQDILDDNIKLSDEGLEFLKNKYQGHKGVSDLVEAYRLGCVRDNWIHLNEILKGILIKDEDIVLFQFLLMNAQVYPRKKTKRLFHTFCNLKRCYRKFILLDGRPLLETDISNSQPTFSVALINSYLKEKKPQLYGKHDMRVYEKHCREGNFYEVIAGKAGVDITDGEQRDQFKEDFYKQIFFAVNSGRSTPIMEAFTQLFPTAARAISGLKKGNYKRFALELQGLEAELMVYTVYKQLLDEGHVVLPLHDAIYSNNEETKQRAEELIKLQFQVKHGMQVAVKNKKNDGMGTSVCKATVGTGEAANEVFQQQPLTVIESRQEVSSVAVNETPINLEAMVDGQSLTPDQLAKVVAFIRKEVINGKTDIKNAA